MYVYHMHAHCIWRPKEHGVRRPGTGVTEAGRQLCVVGDTCDSSTLEADRWISMVYVLSFSPARAI